MKKFSADMKVVRFGAEDVIVTSGALTMVFDAKMENRQAGDGTVTFNGVSSALSDISAMNEICYAIANKYGENAINEGQIGDNNLSLAEILWREVNEGLGAGWAGSYTYDANSKKFIKQ